MPLRPVNIRSFDSGQQRTIEEIYDILNSAEIRVGTRIIRLVGDGSSTISGGGTGTSDFLDTLNEELLELNEADLPNLNDDLDQLNSDLAGKLDDLPNEIKNTHISDDAVDTPQLNANAVTANEIAAGTITANEINSDTITANEIAADTITANELAADSVTANEINVSDLNAVAVNTGALTVSGTLTMGSGGEITNSNDDFTIDENGIALTPAPVNTATRSISWGAEHSIEGFETAGISNIVIEADRLQFHNSLGNYSLTGQKIDLNGLYMQYSPFTDSQRNGLTPGKGAVIFNSDDGRLQVWDGGEWKRVAHT